MGMVQGLDVVLDVAAAVRDLDRVRFCWLVMGRSVSSCNAEWKLSI